MKKNLLIFLAVIGTMANLTAMAQTTLPTIEFENKNPTVIYRKAEDQTLLINIKFQALPTDSNLHTAFVKVAQEGSTDAIYEYEMKPAPWKITFGPGYPKTYTVKIIAKQDTSIKFPCLIRLSLYLDGNTKVLSEHNIFYQPAADKPITKEEKLLKSNEDLKADFNTLRAQLLNGDTSRTYIGKLIIKQKANVVPKDGWKIKEKTVLDNYIDQSKTNKTVRYEENPLTRQTEAKYLINRTSPRTTNQTTMDVTEKMIDSVVVKISEGMIEYLRVKMKDGSYYINSRAPIALLNIENRFRDRLTNPEDSSFVFVKDVINFIVDQRFNYIPSDGVFYLSNSGTGQKSEQKLFTNNGLNSFVDFRIFTDLLGALDNQPNGLLQLEAKSKIYLHRHNIRNNFMYLLHGIEPYMGISKLDSKYDTVKLNTITNAINRMDLYQRSFLNVGLKLNIFRWDFRPSNSFFVNAGYQFNASNISIRDKANKTDSIVAKGIFHMPYAEAGIVSKRMAGFGFEGSAKIMRQLLNKNKYFTNSGYTTLMDFNVTAFYYVGKLPRDKFFVRFSNTLNFEDRMEDFYQLQFGYSLSVKL